MKTRDNAPELLLQGRIDSDKKFLKGIPLASNLGIGGNTFRAFRNAGARPSEIYRGWAQSDGFKIVQERKVRAREQFLDLHRALSDSFSDYWKEHATRSLYIHEKYKVVDLFIKALSYSTGHPSEEKRENLYWHANIPLDQFSLLAIKRMFLGVVLSKNPRMGDIEDEETYQFIQDSIYRFTKSWNIPNLVFDHLAWNMEH